MRRMANDMSFGHSPRFREGERVRTYENCTERYCRIVSWSYHRSEDAYYYWVELESRDIDKRRLKKESELYRT